MLFTVRDEEIIWDKDLLIFPPESESIDMKRYYKYPKFKPLSRDNCTPTVNLSNIFTNSLKLFHLFFSREIMEGFVRVINAYAEIKR
jgi:hypothetical protein